MGFRISVKSFSGFTKKIKIEFRINWCRDSNSYTCPWNSITFKQPIRKFHLKQFIKLLLSYFSTWTKENQAERISFIEKYQFFYLIEQKKKNKKRNGKNCLLKDLYKNYLYFYSHFYIFRIHFFFTISLFHFILPGNSNEEIK